MNACVVEYPGFKLTHIKAESAEEVPFADDQTYSRVEIPFAPDNVVKMKSRGYIFADRTLGVEISLKKSKIDYLKMVRFEICHGVKDKGAILQIALSSFSMDRRFQVSSLENSKVAEVIIRDWVDNMFDVYTCVHKDQVVGFLDLEAFEEKNCFIRLAAIQERYRVAGAAVSLYAYALLKASEKGCEKVYGRISSCNTAVMNLYALLGGIFIKPVDVFVRDENSELR